MRPEPQWWQCKGKRERMSGLAKAGGTELDDSGIKEVEESTISCLWSCMFCGTSSREGK